MLEINRFQVLLDRTKEEYPRFNIKKRDKSWLRPIFWLLGLITRRDYSTFTTTIFSTMYVGPTWKDKSLDDKYKLLRHEKKHVKQAHDFPLGRRAWPINHLLWAICYLLVLPAILTFRAKFEREGYTETLLVQYELEGRLSDLEMVRNALWLAETFGRSTYVFMWRKDVAYEWAMETQRGINAGEIMNPVDRVEELRVAQPPPLPPAA